MSRPPLGQVCIELGLLDEAQVERILRDMREHGQGRFGELAVGLNLLSEEALAQALAAQFHVPLLTAARLACLTVPRDVLALLPVSLMRSRVILPTFIEPDRRTLSLVTSDPTDLPTLQAAVRQARADRLRIFVAARSALATRLDQILPAKGRNDDRADLLLDAPSAPGRGGTVVFETDVEIAATLRRLSRAEGGRAQIVQDPEQVTALLRAGLAERVLYRESLAKAASAYLPVWRKGQAGVQVAAVRGFSPGRRIAVSHRTSRRFYQELLLWLLTTARTGTVARSRIRHAYRLSIELGTEIGIPDEQLEAVSMAAMMAEFGPLASQGQTQGGVDAEPSNDGPMESGREILGRFSPPWDLDGLYAALDRRLNRPSEVTEHLAAELLLVVGHAVQHGIAGVTDSADALRPDFRYLPRLRTALTRVLQRRALRAQLLTAGRRRAVVVVATRDPLLLMDLEGRLETAGFEVKGTLQANTALTWTRDLRPCAVLLSSDVDHGIDQDSEPGGDQDSARLLLAEIRNDSPTSDTPIMVINTGTQQDATHLADLRPDAILTTPLDLDRLETVLRAHVARSFPASDRTHTATGDSRGMPLSDVFEILRAGKQTAAVQVATQREQGTVHVIEGRVHSARFGPRTGDNAWIEIQGMDQVRYAVLFGKQADTEDQAEVLQPPSLTS